MEFKITRTSGYNEEQPCPTAYKKLAPVYDERTFKSFDEYDARFARDGVWLARGTNHCILPNGNISRQLGMEERWFIKIKNLKELMAFVAEYGTLVVGSDEIEIYDGCRE